MPKSTTIEQKIYKLQATKNILLTKGGSLTQGEIDWIKHIEKQLFELGIISQILTS